MTRQPAAKPPSSQRDATSLNTVRVMVSGRLTHFDKDLRRSVGVPGITVRLDWDRDLSPKTHLSVDGQPSGAVTNDNGEYAFDFTVMIDTPTSYKRLRIFAELEIGNAATYPSKKSYDYRSRFVNQAYVSITKNGDQTISASNKDIDITSPDAGILRYMYRARQFGYRCLVRRVCVLLCGSDPHVFLCQGTAKPSPSLPRAVWSLVLAVS